MPEKLTNTVFYLGLGTLFAHELDAMPAMEWRLLPFLQTLPDDLGMTVFVLLHIPLFAVIVALVASRNEKTRAMSRLVLSAFLLLHAALHAWFSGDAGYGFVSSLSGWLIYGGAVLGALYLVLAYPGRRPYPKI